MTACISNTLAWSPDVEMPGMHPASLGYIAEGYISAVFLLLQALLRHDNLDVGLSPRWVSWKVPVDSLLRQITIQ